MKRLAPLIASIVIVATPALAGKQDDALAACMWEKMPTTTEKFLTNKAVMDDFELFMKASAPCDTRKGRSTISFKSMKKRLVKIRPASVGVDTVKPDNVFICEKGADGKLQPCRTPGE